MLHTQDMVYGYCYPATDKQIINNNIDATGACILNFSWRPKSVMVKGKSKIEN